MQHIVVYQVDNIREADSTNRGNRRTGILNCILNWDSRWHIGTWGIESVKCIQTCLLRVREIQGLIS